MPALANAGRNTRWQRSSGSSIAPSGERKTNAPAPSFSRRVENDYVTDAILAAAKNDNWEMNAARQQFDVYLAGNCSFWFRVNEFDFRCRYRESEPSAPGRRAGPL